MPRLTNPQYLAQRQRLKVDWFDRGGSIIGRLDPIDQMDLHAFFAHSRDLTDEQALAHRIAATAQYPSLPQIAGRLYAKIHADLGTRPAPAPVSTTSRRKPETNVKVEAFGLMRPTPNMEKLYDALFMMAERELRGGEPASDASARHASSTPAAMSTLRRAVRQQPAAPAIRFRRAGRRARRRRP
jgi:hypothetical protein